MAFKGLIAAATSVALVTAPTMAMAQRSAASASATHEVAPATETVEGSELRGGFIIPLIALIAIILGLCAAHAICDDDEDLPHSP